MTPFFRVLRARPIVLALFCAACGSADGGGAVVQTLANGAVHVRNPAKGAWTEKTAWHAVEELRIGSEDGGGPDMFAEPIGLEVDAAGRMYVLDRQSKEIRVFGPDGKHLRTVGREGGGPGEFKNPVGLAFDRSGALWVVDPQNARYTVLDSTGRQTATHPRRSMLTVVPWRGRVDAEGGLWDVTMNPETRGTQLMRLRDGADDGRRYPLPSIRDEQFELRKDGQIRMAVDVPFSPGLRWSLDREGRLWSGTGAEYRIARHAPGGDTLLLVEKEFEPVPVSVAERDSIPLQYKWFTDQGGKMDLSRVPASKPAFSGFVTDDRGWLWVMPTMPANARATTLDVFTPEGRYQGAVTLPVQLSAYLPLVIRGPHLYTVALNDDEVPQVVRYRLQGRP
ncbi:MAG TPA: 6-bladed beta-propeller [Longimicrobium sp.]|jgi:hypothetical protein|uniref:6-bladed beta-propeller n=1 Tax=Longimicrobium sp. TaxID=2029185 RepID=UPI002ED7EA6E